MRNKLLMLGLIGLVGQSVAAGVFFSEYIEGSSNNKALEIFNNMGTSIEMADVSIIRYNNGSTTPSGGPYAYTGTLVDGDVFVVANSSAAQPVLDASDTTDGSTWYNGDDVLELYYQGTLVDVIGLLGEDPGSSWPVGSGATSNYTLTRQLTVCEGSLDWAIGATQWDVHPIDTFTELGAHAVDCAANQPPYVLGVDVLPTAPVAPLSPLSFSVTADDNDGTVVTVEIAYGTDAGSLGTPELMIDAGGMWVNALPIIAPEACEALYYEITATDDDGATGTYSGNVGVTCSATIYEIQGQLADSPFAGVSLSTTGIVTAVAYNGFYVQDGAGAWNGIWVYAGNGNTAGLLVGDSVVVTGDVIEYYGLTEINNGTFVVQSSGNPLPAYVLLSTADVNDEAYEGVRVRIEEAFIGETNSYGEFTADDGSGPVVVDDQIIDTRYEDPENPGEFLPLFEEGECYDVVGPLNWSYGAYKISATSILPCGTIVDAEELTSSFELGQAYPNPFNPTTTISFSMDVTSQARLSVYNLLGAEVAVLSEGVVEAGAHQVTFDASALSSGMYFYRLQSEGRNLTGRMLLVK